MMSIHSVKEEKKKKKKPLDDIEKYRDPDKLFQEIHDGVLSLEKHLYNFSSFRRDDEVIKCQQLLRRFVEEIARLVPSVRQLDYSDVPANGLRSCLRLWIKYLHLATEMNNEGKLRKFVIALTHHLCLWPPLIQDAVACMASGHFEASVSRQHIKYFYSTYNRMTHETLMNSKLILRTFDVTMFPFLLFFLRIGVWSTEPSWKRKIFSEHYLTYKHTLRSLLKRLDTVRPESAAAWVRSANWFITQTYVRTVNSIIHPWRDRRVHVQQETFRILCPSKYRIDITNETISLVEVDEQRVHHEHNNNNNNNGKKKNDGHLRRPVDSKVVKFFMLRSTCPLKVGREKESQVSKDDGKHFEEKADTFSDSTTDEGKEKAFHKSKLVKSAGGRCAFFSQKKVENVKCQRSGENDGKILIYIHGGAFFGPESASLINIFLRDWSARLPGVTVIVPEYSYAPESSFPVAWQEMLDLYIWLVSSPEASCKLGMNIDPRKIVLSGDSSGGLLSSSLLVMLNEINRKFQQSIPIPREVVLLFPKCSLRLEVTPSILLSNYDLVINGFMLARVAQAVLPITKRNRQNNSVHLISSSERKNLHPEWFKDDDYQVLDSPILSPLTYDRWNDLAHVNLNIVVVTFDPLMDDGVQFAKKWRGKVNFHVADNICHGAYYYRQFTASANSFNDKALSVISSAISSL